MAGPDNSKRQRRHSTNDKHSNDSRFDFATRNKHHNNKQQPSIVNQGPVYLQNEWAFWYDANNAKGLNKEDYENSIIKFGTFKTIQDFWKYYNNIVDPQYFPSCSNLRLFKDGIKPLWEDSANANGGQWTIRTQKNETGKMWIQLVLYIIGEQFTYSNDICGVVLSVRPRNDTINIWNRNSNNINIINTTIDQIRQFLDIKRNIVYKKNEGSLTQNVDDPNVSENRLTKSASDILSDVVKNTLCTNSLEEISVKYSLAGDSESSDIGDYSTSDSDSSEISNLDSESESDDSKSKHKKSSSYSSSPFVLKSPSWKQHRKTHSQDANKKSSIIPKYNHLQSNHRRQNSDERATLQKSKFFSNYASLQKELYSRSSDFAPYEVDLSDLKQTSELQVDAKEISALSTKQSLSTFLFWTVGSLFLILLWAISSWQSDLFSISI